eukprot:1313550-Pleurochrysis_carterae.AAC.3
MSFSSRRVGPMVLWRAKCPFSPRRVGPMVYDALFVKVCRLAVYGATARYTLSRFQWTCCFECLTHRVANMPRHLSACLWEFLMAPPEMCSFNNIAQESLVCWHVFRALLSPLLSRLLDLLLLSSLHLRGLSLPCLINYPSVPYATFTVHLAYPHSFATAHF